MHAIEYFEVECPEQVGRQVLSPDRRCAASTITCSELFINFTSPSTRRFPSLSQSVSLKKLTTRVRVRDIADVNVQERKLLSRHFGDETYLAPLLKIFWQKYGEDQVKQPDRFTVILYDVRADVKEIEEIVVADPSESLYEDLIYALR